MSEVGADRGALAAQLLQAGQAARSSDPGYRSDPGSGAPPRFDDTIL